MPDGRGDPGPVGSSEAVPYRTLLKIPQTWGIVIAKSLTDPVWFFITDWFTIYLVSRGFKPAIASGSMASRLEARRVMEPVCQCSSSLPVVSTSG